VALLNIDSKTLKLTLSVGILEEYKPTEKIKEVYNLVKDLSDITNSKLKSFIGDAVGQEALDILDSDAEKKEKWTHFLNNDYNEKLATIIEKIRAVNREICPDYKALVNK